MSTKPKKFIESHWLLFAGKGVISLIVGLCMMLSFNSDAMTMAKLVSFTMMILAGIELMNAAYRVKANHGNVGFPLILGIIELGVAVSLLFAINPSLDIDELIWLRIAILSGYTFFASLITIVMGFKSFTNMTDRMMWIINGMVGMILAIVMLPSDALLMTATAHIKLFGAYLMVNGLTDLFFGIHSRDEALLDKADRLAKRIANKKDVKKGKK